MCGSRFFYFSADAAGGGIFYMKESFFTWEKAFEK